MDFQKQDLIFISGLIEEKIVTVKRVINRSARLNYMLNLEQRVKAEIKR